MHNFSSLKLHFVKFVEQGDDLNRVSFVNLVSPIKDSEHKIQSEKPDSPVYHEITFKRFLELRDNGYRIQDFHSVSGKIIPAIRTYNLSSLFLDNVIYCDNDEFSDSTVGHYAWQLFDQNSGAFLKAESRHRISKEWTKVEHLNSKNKIYDGPRRLTKSEMGSLKNLELE